MFLLHLTSYFAALVAFLFVTLSLASGLLYIAEAIEENSSLAKTIGKRLIYGIISLQILLCVFDGIPVSLTLLGIICHIVYLSNFSSNWPFISLTSPKFILSIVLVILDHFAYFFFFAEQSKNPAAWRNPSQRVPYRPSWEDRKAARNSGFGFGQGPPGIMEIATFFGVCVWLVPFYLFLSLSANDNVLPSNVDLNDPAYGPKIIATAPNQEQYPTKSRPPNLNLSAIQASQSTGGGSIFRAIVSAIPLPNLRKARTSHRELDGLIASPALLPRSRPSSPAPHWNEGNQQWGGMLSPSPSLQMLDDRTRSYFDSPPSPNIRPSSPLAFPNNINSLSPKSSLSSFTRRQGYDSPPQRPGSSGGLPRKSPVKKVQRATTSPTESSSSATSSTRSSADEEPFRFNGDGNTISDHAMGMVGMGMTGLAKRKVV